MRTQQQIDILRTVLEGSKASWAVQSTKPLYLEGAPNNEGKNRGWDRSIQPHPRAGWPSPCAGGALQSLQTTGGKHRPGQRQWPKGFHWLHNRRDWKMRPKLQCTPSTVCSICILWYTYYIIQFSINSIYLATLHECVFSESEVREPLWTQMGN